MTTKPRRKTLTPADKAAADAAVLYLRMGEFGPMLALAAIRQHVDPDRIDVLPVNKES